MLANVSSFFAFQNIRRRGLVGRIPAFQAGYPGSIPGGVRYFNSYPGIRCVSFVGVLSCAVSGGGPDSVLTTHLGRFALLYLSSVLVHRQLLPLQACDLRAFRLSVPAGVSPRLGGSLHEEERKKEGRKFQNFPCWLGFEVKYSKLFCIHFRPCVITLINKFELWKMCRDERTWILMNSMHWIRNSNQFFSITLRSFAIRIMINCKSQLMQQFHKCVF